MSFSIENAKEVDMETQMRKATQHFTSKDQLLPFIPINPNTEPEQIEPFSEDEEEIKKYIDENIDYEKIIDKDLGMIPKQTPTILIQEQLSDPYGYDQPENPHKTMTEYYQDTMK